MKLFFLDDARQNSPSRAGMGRLIAVAGFCLADTLVGEMERAIDALCRDTYNFPPGEEFKWSPGRNLWMRDNLVAEERFKFYTDVLGLVREVGAVASVIIEDCNFARATDAPTHEEDVVRMSLERVSSQCSDNPSEGLVITDRRIGGNSSEDDFLQPCLENIQDGARYIRPRTLALNVVSTPSKFIRLLQVADLITGATLAAVGGEVKFSLPVVQQIDPLYRKSFGYVDGYGVKIHPDYRYANLYHWVFGDELLVKFNTGTPLPMPHRPYAGTPTIP